MFDCDFLLAFPLMNWPSPANEWIHRERYWPDLDIIKNLASLPCHVIAKPMAEGHTSSWRYSFSRQVLIISIRFQSEGIFLQELQIANILPLNARLCYIGLKYIFKKYIKEKFPLVLKSYHILTIFLWFMESRSPTIWKNEGDDSFCENLKDLLLFTSESLSFCEIPHYFIRKIDLDENLPGCGQLPTVAKYICKIINEDGFPR